MNSKLRQEYDKKLNEELKNREEDFKRRNIELEKDIQKKLKELYS